MNLFALKDSLVNFVTGLGTSKDPTANATFQFNVLNRNTLENMYRSDWIARKVVDAPAEDATREWRAWHASQQQITAIQALEKKHDLQRKMRQAIIRGRLYGGAALVLGVDQGREFEELDYTKVGKDGLKFVVVLNRYELMAGPRIYNVDSPWYTRPEYYTVATPMFGFSFEGGTSYPMGSTNVIPYPKNGGGDRARQMTPYTGMVQIHPSRVIEFIGNELPDWRLIPMGGNWGDSILQTIEEVIRDIGLMTGGAANMVNDAKMDVIKIPGFTKNITTDEYSNRLLKRFMIANTSKSSINSILLDADEEWNRIQTSFGGLPDLLREFFTVVAGAADIPVSKLVGASPGRGLAAQGSSGGEQDEKGYYDRVASKQETVYRPAMEPLDEVLIRSALGARDPNIEYVWNPLWQMSEDEKAKVDAQKAATTQIYVNLGILNEDALRQSVVNQLIEDQVYPGLEDAIEEFGAEPAVPDAPFGYDPATGEPASAQGLLKQHSKLMGADPNSLKKQLTETKDFNPNHDPHSGEFSSSGDSQKQLTHAEVLNAVREKLKDPETLKSASDTATWSVMHWLLTNGAVIGAFTIATLHLAKTAVKLNKEYHILEKVTEYAKHAMDAEPQDQYRLSQKFIDYLVRELKVNEQQLQALRFSADGMILGHRILDFDPDEPRDKDGKWTKGGSSSKSQTSEPSKILTENSIENPSKANTSEKQTEAKTFLTKHENKEVKLSSKSDVIEAKSTLEKAVDFAKSTVDSPTKIALWGFGLTIAYRLAANSDTVQNFLASDADKIHAQAVGDIARAVAQEQGFDPSKIVISHIDTQPNDPFASAELAHYENPEYMFNFTGGDKIVLYHKNFDPTDAKAITHTISHEIMHSVFYKAQNSPEVMNYISNNLESLAKSGPKISGYAASSWEDLPPHQAINETLGDIAGDHVTKGKLPDNREWRTLYDLVRKAGSSR